LKEHNNQTDSSTTHKNLGSINGDKFDTLKGIENLMIYYTVATSNWLLEELLGDKDIEKNNYVRLQCETTASIATWGPKWTKIMIADGKKQWSDPLDTDGNAKVKSIMRRIIDEKYCGPTCCAANKARKAIGWD